MGKSRELTDVEKRRVENAIQGVQIVLNELNHNYGLEISVASYATAVHDDYACVFIHRVVDEDNLDKTEVLAIDSFRKIEHCLDREFKSTDRSDENEQKEESAQ